MSTKKILLVDDEQDILELMQYSLTREGFEVVTAGDGYEGWNLALKEKPEIIILDIMMPGMDGIELCRKLRGDARFKETFILILTARGEEYSEIAGFDAGADDYVVKPVKIRSLVKRLEALGRRTTGNAKEETLKAGDLVIDPEAYKVVVGDEEIKLPRKEFELLHLLAKNPDRVIRRERILQEVWGNDNSGGDRTIDVHIRRIRKRIGEERIETVKGIGYKLVSGEQS